MRRGIALLALLSALPATAATIPLEQALEVCRAEKNALRRLACYDTINTGDLTSITSAPSSVTTNTVTPAAPRTKDRNSEFGMEHHTGDAAEEMTVIIDAIKYNAHKELVIEFSNGQVWQQIGTDYYKVSAGETHVIRRGVLNSFLLGNERSNRSIRVKRVK